MFNGSGVAIVTPFDFDKKINFKSLEQLLEFQIENKTDAIIICGTTGESATLTDKEKISLIEFTVKKVSGKIPVIAGTGSNNTEHAKSLTLKAKNAGVDAALIVTPYYNKTTQTGIIDHYKEISQIDIPIIIYNVPSRTGMNILPETYKELIKIKNIVGVKEASGNISQVAEIKFICEEYKKTNKKDFKIYSGNDDQIIPVLSLGCHGVISVLANIFPLETHMICENYFNKYYKESLEIQLKFLPLIKNLFCEVNPIPIKYAMNKLGFNVGDCRLPLTKISEDNARKLNFCLDKLKR